MADQCTCQLTIKSQASKASKPLTISAIKIAFEGGIKPILVRHQESDSFSKTSYAKVELSEGGDSPEGLTGNQDLTVAPNQIKVFEFTFPLRESGHARAISATFTIEAESFQLDYVVDFDQVVVPDIWWHQDTARKRLVRIDPYLINIMPKPPKMDVRFVELHDQYYTNEAIKLQLEVLNGEEEGSTGSLHVYVNNDHGPQIHLKLDEAPEDETDTSRSISKRSLGTIGSGKSKFITVEIPPTDISSAYDLIVDLSYNLVSDLETPISRTMSIRLFVVSPFEANYDFAPRYDETPWPSYFSHEELCDLPEDGNEQNIPKAAGIQQRWCLKAMYASFAVSTLLVKRVDVTTLSVSGGISCYTTPLFESGPSDDTPLVMEPNASEETNFTVVTQKISLDDRRSGSLDLALSISWQRSADSSLNTTLLPVPRLLVASQEPRVLLHISPHPSSSPATPILVVSYTIENPSMHFLTFGMVMNPSEDFAFSGTKSGTAQLVPLSRRTVSFVVIPNPSVRGQWIRPVFVVRDRYFQKVLKVSPGEGCRADKDGVSIWVPAKDDEEE